MKWLMKAAGIGMVLCMGLVWSSQAQVQQSISISLNVYNQTASGVRTVRVSTRDVIRFLAGGNNVPGGKLWLVMPSDPSPDGSGNIGAFLRVTGSDGTIIDTSSDSFNVYQTVSSQTASRTVAFNQFSFDFGGLGAELYGTATWSGKIRGGQGSFHCTVSGHCAVGGETDGEMPCTGSISGGAPRPAE